MKNTVNVIIGIVLLGVTVCSCVIAGIQTGHCKKYREVISQQEIVIDSLISLPRNSTTVELYVTDRSTVKLNAKKASGTITFPNTKIYELKIDSVKRYTK